MAALNLEERARLRFTHWGPVAPDPDSKRYREELTACLSEMGLGNNVEFCGFTDSIADRLREADWFVLPSTNEPCSVALIESMALGLPALVSASGGNVDIVKPGVTGLLFQPDCPKDLAAQLRLILNERVAVQLPTQIRESVLNRSASAVLPEFVRLYRSMCANTTTAKVSSGPTPRVVSRE